MRAVTVQACETCTDHSARIRARAQRRDGTARTDCDVAEYRTAVRQCSLTGAVVILFSTRAAHACISALDCLQVLHVYGTDIRDGFAAATPGCQNVASLLVATSGITAQLTGEKLTQASFGNGTLGFSAAFVHFQVHHVCTHEHSCSPELQVTESV